MERLAPLLIVLATAGCALPAAERDSLGSAKARLIGGTPDTGDPAVVLLQTTGAQGGECTAVLVASQVLLSAAHCVVDEYSGAPLTSAGFRIYRGNDFAAAGEADWIPIDSSNVHAHPSYQGDDHDIAVLVLSDPLPIAAVPVSTGALSASDVGKPVRLVGYGSNAAAGGGGTTGSA